MDFVSSIYSPLVAVAVSECVRITLEKNNVSGLEHLLSPLSSPISGVPVTLPDIFNANLESSSNIANFHLRFRSFSNLDQYSVGDAVNTRLQDYLDAFTHAKNVSVDILKLGEQNSGFGNEIPQTYHCYKDLIAHNLESSEHDTFNHPIAGIFAISTLDFKDFFEALSSGQTTPDTYFTTRIAQLCNLADYKPYIKGFADPNFLKHHLLIHDATDAFISRELIDAIVSRLKTTCGSNVSLLILNTVQSLEDEYTNHSLWLEYYSKRYQSDIMVNDFEKLQKLQYARYLSDLDIRNITTFLGDFTCQYLFPYMKKNINQWNEQVAASRRNITSRLLNVGKKYFGSSSNKVPATITTVDESGSIIYNHTSPEMILRKLADFSFMLREYKFAYSIYDTVKKDFQANDKATKYYAGILEMQGICSILGDLKGSDAFLENSINIYNSIQHFGYETRVVCVYHELMKSKQRQIGTIPLLERIANEQTGIRRAIFLEECAVSYLSGYQKMFRKSAMQYVMAGKGYSDSALRGHAFRCYTTSLKVYDNLGWSLIEDHINFNIGSEAYKMSEIKDAVTFFIKLLKSSQQCAEQQQVFLNEFLNIYSELQRVTQFSDVILPPLKIPELDVDSIHLSLSQDDNIVDLSESDGSWVKMEEDLIDYFNVHQNTGAEIKITSNGSQASGCYVTCAVDEPVYLHFELCNPMHVSLVLNNILPIIETEDGAIKTIDVISELVLKPLERKKIKLEIIPNTVAQILVTGFKYILCSTIPSSREFSVQSKYGKTTLKINVTPPMPIIEIKYHAVPDVLLSGEIVRCVLEINNRGYKSLGKLGVKLSHASFIYIGKPSQVEQPAYSFVDDNRGSGNIDSLACENIMKDPSFSFLDIGDDGVILPGATILLPMWIRGDKIGKSTFKLLFGYQTEDDSSSWKTSKYTFSLTVQPSLRINAFTRASGQNINEFIFGLEVENLQTMVNINLLQISSISPAWIITYLGHELVDDYINLIAPRQTAYVYFKFKKYIKNLDDSSSPENMVTTAVERLVSLGTIEAIQPPPLSMYASTLTKLDQRISTIASPFTNFSSASRYTFRNTFIKQNYPSLKSSHIANLFSLYLTDDIDISVAWEIPGAKRRGHHYIMGINTSLQQPLQMQNRFGRLGLQVSGLKNANKALFAETVRENKVLVEQMLKGKEVSPVRVLVSGENIVRGRNGVCTDIVFKIANTSRVNKVAFQFEVCGDTSVNSGVKWLGLNKWTGELVTEEEKSYIVTAFFPRIGVYDVQTWRITVTLEFPHVVKAEENAGHFIQTPTFPHLITVV